MAKYKHLYEQTSVMLAKYQDELIPQYRKIIEGLEADNERLRDMWAKAVSDASKADAQIPKWIPVTERLPESEKCVLVYSKDGGVAEGKYNARFNEWVQFRWNVTKLRNVTHWMPLPEPPKGE